MAGPIRIAILAQAIQARKDIKKVTKDLTDMGKSADKADKPTNKISDTVGKLTKNAVGAAKAVGQAVAPIAAAASAAVSAAPAVAAAGAALLNVARSAAGAAPALAAFAAAGLFVKLTMAQIAPAIAKSLEPVTKAFQKAGTAAGELAAKGIGPLASAFAKSGIPIVADAMNRIATSTNKVVKGFLAWANSSSGLTALRNITGATATAFASVAPHVLALATALGEMIGRIAGVSLAAGSSGLNRVLDLLTAKLKTITGASVQAGLDGLKSAFLAVRDTVLKVAAVVQVAIGVYRRYQAQIMLISDALAVIAIVFGGPVTAIIAAVGLIVRHFEFVKTAIAQVKAAFATPGNVAFLDQLRTAVATVWPPIVAAFNAIKAAVLPTLTQIVQKVRTELVPALAEFIAAAAPVVAFFITQFTPIIASAFKTIVGVISAAITVISGIFTVFTALLTGDWSKLWDGIKTIVRGAAGAIKAVLSGFFTVIKGYFSAAKGVVSGVWSSLWSLVRGATSAAVKNVIGLLAGLVASVRDKFQAVKDAISSKLTAAYSSVKSTVGRIKSAFSINLFAAGAKIIQSLISGITSRAGALIDKVSGLAQSIRDHFPFSPARRGPLKRKPMGLAGRNIVRDLARGITQERKARLAISGVAGLFTQIDRVTPNLGIGQTGRLNTPAPINVHFHNLITDPAATGREVERVLNRYRVLNGRRPV